jgi:hypothetical protein
MTEHGARVDIIALPAAEQIEDLLAQHHQRGRAQRLAKIRSIVRAVAYEIAKGLKAGA